MLVADSMRIIKADLWDATQTFHKFQTKILWIYKRVMLELQSVREERRTYWNVDDLI